MSKMQRPRALACLVLAAAWLVSAPGPLSLFNGRATAQEPSDFGDAPGQDANVPDQDFNVPDQVGVPGQEGDDMEGDETQTQGRRAATKKARPSRSAASRTAKAKASRKSAAASGKNATTDEVKKAATPDRGVTFSQDVAPILVANCIGCHTQGRPGLERGKLDLTTFEKLMKGTTTNEKVVMPGKPAESHLILRIKGVEEPRMPQGGNNNGLAEPVISRFEEWVKSGATLDPGLDPKAPIASYAASLADVERSSLAKLSPADRLAKITATGLDRWKKANPALKPEITPGEHFVVFTDAPKERAAATLKAMETQYANLRRLLGPGATQWAEKVSLYVFSDRKDYVEFVRTVEQREVDAEEAGHGDLGKPEPYVVAADPQDAAAKSEPAAKRKTSRRRRGERDADDGGATRSLVGLLTENMVESAVLADGKSPRWLATGLGLLMASQVERRPEYYVGLRRLALEKWQQDWATNASQVLGDGDGVSQQEFRAVSLALVECLTSPRFRELFPALAKGMTQGGDKLDDVLKNVYGATRDVFFNVTGEWVAAAYGGGQ